MFRKIIDSVYDVMVGFREHPLLLCLAALLVYLSDFLRRGICSKLCNRNQDGC